MTTNTGKPQSRNRFQRALLSGTFLSTIATGSLALLMSVPSHATQGDTTNTNTSITNNAIKASLARDGLVAVVNDTPILKSDWQYAVQQTQARYLAAGESLPPADQLEAEVLNALVLRQLQLSLVQRAGIRPTDEQLNQQLANIAQSQGLTGIAQLQQQMDDQQAGSYAALRQQIMEDLSIQLLQQQQIMRRVRISEQDIDALLASPEGSRLNQSEYRTIHIRVPYIDDYSRLSEAQREQARLTAEQVRTALIASGDNVEAVMQAAQGTYPVPLQGGDMGYHKAAGLPTTLAKQIVDLDVGGVSELMMTPEGIDIIKLADKKDSGDMHIPQWQTRHILVKVDDLNTQAMAQQKINDLYEQLRSGADFASLAATYSDDPGSAGRGGSLDWVSEGEMVPSFEQMMKQTPVGDFSTPFQSPFGWHILQVEATRKHDVSEQYRRNLARERLYQRMAPQAQEDWLQELKASAYIKYFN